MKITKLIGREIFDSRGIPALECELFLEDGISVLSSVASGPVRGCYEAQEIRDGGSRLGSMGLQQAINNIEAVIAPQLFGKEPNVLALDLHLIEYDGTPNKARLGANSMLATSIAVLRAQAMLHEMRPYELIAHLCDFETVGLPFGMFSIINGTIGAKTHFPIQDIMIIPAGAPSFRRAMEIALAIFAELKLLLIQNKKTPVTGENGGFVAPFDDIYQALDFVMEAIARVESAKEMNVVLALDVAANHYYDPAKNIYVYNKKKYSSSDLIAFYADLAAQYPLYSLEDCLGATDLNGWVALTNKLGETVQLAGDAFFGTHTARIVHALENSMANAAIIKPNQVGTVTETLQAIKLCKKYNFGSIVSTQLGETRDPFIVDLAIGTSAGQFKAGGLMRGERIDKYNHLLTIEDELMNSMLNA